MIKVALFAICAVIIGLQFKSSKQEYGLYICAAAAVIIMAFALSRLEAIVAAVDKINKYIEIDKKYIAMLFKIIGITYIAEFVAALCKDSGYTAIGGQVELAGKLSIMAVGMPVLSALIDTVAKML